MKSALLLVDLQRDFLDRRPLHPGGATVVARATKLLRMYRTRDLPVIHIRQSVTRDPDNRMPHWKADGRWLCVVGTPGHQAPAGLEPLASEPVVGKAFFSGFGSGQLDSLLRDRGVDSVVLCGIFLPNCIRATALDAWERGFRVIVAEDAVGNSDPLDAIATTRFLSGRGIDFLPVDQIAARLDGRRDESIPDGVACLPAVITGRGPAVAGGTRFIHRSPGHTRQVLWAGQAAGVDEVAVAVRAAREARSVLGAATADTRCRWLLDLAAALGDEATATTLARQIAVDVGKPLRDAQAEVARCRRLLAAAVGNAGGVTMRSLADGSQVRRVPLGVVAAITPWNHPLAIPVGKIAPALIFGNTVVWKPAPAATRLAMALVGLMRTVGWPDDLVTLVCGGAATAQALMDHPGVDAISLTGGSAAGFHASRVAALRRIPLQAELGGNNAAVIWTDRDATGIAHRIASAAFGFAGQRCTANRRVVVARDQLPSFLERLARATRDLVWGDPLDDRTVVGPVISAESRETVEIALAAAGNDGHRIMVPHAGTEGDVATRGWYTPPAIVVCDDGRAEIVQRELFGPVLVVQPADGWDHAIALANGVEQGLVAALFADEEERWRDFLTKARAGVLKRNGATADAGVDAPFGGWKASGVGPPEHGPGNLEFHTRLQAIYED